MPSSFIPSSHHGTPDRPSRLATDPRVGMLLDRRYFIRRVLGAGGMGTVYLADDRLLGRRVALKMVRPERSTEPAEQLRLETEAGRLARVQSSRVVALLDLLTLPDGQRCAVMELVEGESLDRLLKRKRLTQAQAAHVAVEVCRALRDVHDHGLLHLDVKPANILLGARGMIKLADLGLALPMSSGRVVDPNRAGGTLPYMPLEQLTGDLLYPASDLYSIGILYYEMLAGDVPFRSDRLDDYRDAHRQGVVRRAAATHPLVPAECRPVLLRALAGRCWERYVEARLMLDDLKRLRKSFGDNQASFAR